MQVMKAVILADGLAIGLSGETHILSKPTVQIGGKTEYHI